MRSKTFPLALCGLFVVFSSAAAFAQTEPGAKTPQTAAASQAVDPDANRLSSPQDSFGIQDRSVTHLPMALFHPRNGASTWTYSATGYVSRATGSGLLWAPLTIPNGALIDTVRAWIFDNSAGDIGVYLTEFAALVDNTNDIGSVFSTGTGQTSIAFFPAYTVNNGTNLYVIYLDMPIDANVRSKGVRVLWYRQVTAAPVTATFGDVPVGNPFHRFVEALVAAGITGGCGAGNYCPNQAVTRGQMAVFLSAALGLHHPF